MRKTIGFMFVVCAAIFAATVCGQSLNSGSFTNTYQNDASTGTVRSGLASLGTPGKVIRTASGATSGVIGICDSGCGIDGTVTIATGGKHDRQFDGATTYGDFVQIGAAGYTCHDTGSALPLSSGSQVIGMVLGTNAGAGTYPVQIQLGNPSQSLTPETNPAIAYTAYPGSPSGTPTIAQCEALVQALAATLAQRAWLYSVVLGNSFASTVTGQSSGATVTVNGNTGTLAALTNVTEAVPVDLVSANSALENSLASRLAWQAAKLIDGALTGVYPNFNINSPVGSPGSVLTSSALDAVISGLAGNGEPMTVVINPTEWLDITSNTSDAIAAVIASAGSNRPAAIRGSRCWFRIRSQQRAGRRWLPTTSALRRRAWRL